MAPEHTATETTLDVREIDGRPFDDASSSRTQTGDKDEALTVIWRN